MSATKNTDSCGIPDRATVSAWMSYSPFDVFNLKQTNEHRSDTDEHHTLFANYCVFVVYE